MSRLVSAIDPLLDTCPVDMAAFSQGSLLQRLRALRGVQVLFRAGKWRVMTKPWGISQLQIQMHSHQDLFFEGHCMVCV